MSIINLPVSLGEALDKLTILDIKINKIKDRRLNDVKKEYSVLYEKLKVYLDKFKFYYKILKQINLDIWEMQDDFRYNNGDKIKLCLQIIDDNDRRFRVKKKINDLTKSELKEQKGYKARKAFILTNLELSDNINTISMVRYLSTCYDEVIVVCKNVNKKDMEYFYQDDNSIKIYGVDNEKDISPNYGFNKEKFNEITKDYSLYLCGNHNLSGVKCNYKNLPLCFYEQVNLNPNIFWDYFYTPIIQEANYLYKKISKINYVFIHNTTSSGKVFEIDLVEKKLNLDKEKILFINPNLNCYEEKDNFYELANEFIGHKLSYYTEIIKNAEYNILCDSSFMCMAINFELKNNNNYYCSRNNGSYDKLYSDKYIFTSNEMKKIFKSLN